MDTLWEAEGSGSRKERGKGAFFFEDSKGMGRSKFLEGKRLLDDHQ